MLFKMMKVNPLHGPAGLLLFILVLAPPLALFSGASVAPAFILTALTLVAWKRPSPALDMSTSVPWIAATALAWALLSSSWSPAPAFQALRTTLSVATLTVLGTAAFQATKRLTQQERRWAGIALLIGCTLSTVLLLIETGTDYVLIQGVSLLLNGERLTNPQAEESRGTVLLLLALWPTIGICLRWGLRAVLPLVACTSFAVIAESKYASILALGAGGLAFILAWAAQARGLRVLRLGMIVLILGMPALGLILPSVEDLKTGNLFNSARHRVVIWQFSIDQWEQQPLRGWGMDASRAMPGGEDATIVMVKGKARDYQNLPLHPHNGLLQIWLELGLPGAVCAAALLWATIGHLLRTPMPRERLALISAAITAATVIGTVSYGIWQSWWLSALWLTTLLFATTAPDIRNPASP